MVGVNEFTLDKDLQELLVDNANWDFVWPRMTPQNVLPQESFYKIDCLVPNGIAALLRMILQTNQWLAVGKDGFADKPVEEVGNYRLSNFNVPLADLLWERLRAFLPCRRTMDEFSPTDHGGHALWRPVGVSPLFRFIRYAEGGQLVGHYDATYESNDTHRTLMSMVIYLTPNERGATRFLRDAQLGKPIVDYDFADWDRAGHDDEVIARFAPEIGNAVIFDHRLLHDSEPLEAGDPEKIIIRTDIMFEKITDANT